MSVEQIFYRSEDYYTVSVYRVHVGDGYKHYILEAKTGHTKHDGKDCAEIIKHSQDWQAQVAANHWFEEHINA